MKPAVLILACGVLGIGLMTAYEYIFGDPTATAWTGTVPMASPTALAFILVAAALLILSRK